MTQQQWRRSGKRRDKVKLSFPQKLMVFLVSTPPLWILMYSFAGFFLNLTLYMTKLRVPGSGAVLRFYGPVAIYSSYLFQNIAIGNSQKCTCFSNKLQLCSRSGKLSPIKTSRYFLFFWQISALWRRQNKKEKDPVRDDKCGSKDFLWKKCAKVTRF